MLHKYIVTRNTQLVTRYTAAKASKVAVGSVMTAA